MKVGEYCRNNQGKIGTICYIRKFTPTDPYYCIQCDKFEDYENNIIKSSPNIIDLIEVGDIVYVDISPDDCGGIIVPRIAETERELNSLKLLIENKDYILKSIITHEQIENMEYKVKE